MINHSGARGRRIVDNPIRILRNEPIPEQRVPHEVAQVDAQNESFAVDRFRQRDARMPGKAVEQLAQSEASDVDE